MIDNKKINIIVGFMITLAFILGITVIGIGNKQAQNQEQAGETVVEASYAQEIFGVDIISIEIVADENDWQTMIDNAISEQYIMVDVIVNGTKFEKVGIRPKGNSSLTQIADDDTTNRFSFRLQFNEYIDGQTCFGLESFVVNNMLGDNTYMKEYISYELMETVGVDAPYFGYANIKLNGEAWGLYLAVELYNESYEERVYGDTTGMLYNVKSMEMGAGKGAGGVGGGFSAGNADADGTGDVSGDDAGTSATTNMKKSSFAKGNGGGSLEYTDDQVSSYSAIFGNVVGKGNDAEYAKVIEALKALSEERDIEKYFNVNQILKYLAAHTMVVNLDSYSSSMAQNYYIYENDEQITILPWDYNLAWGGFQNSSASDVINFPIDTPVSGVEMSTRPLIEKLFNNAEYLSTYHNYLEKMLYEYFTSGKFEIKVQELNTLIASYVEKDATALCTYEEYEKAVQVFIELGNLRAQSVKGQLDGTIPSTTASQKANEDKLISGESINLSTLGTMMGGGKMEQGSFSKEQYAPSRPGSDTTSHPFDKEIGGIGDRGNRATSRGLVASDNFLLWGILAILLLLAIFALSKFKKKY